MQAEAQKEGGAGRRLPERVSVRTPEGTVHAIERAASRERMTPADWKRRAIRRAIEAADRKGGTP